MTTDLIVATPEFAVVTTGYQQSADNLLEQAERAVIDSQEKAERGSDFLKIAKGAVKQATEYRKGLTDAYTKRIKVINGEIKKITDTLDKAITIAGQKALDWQLAQEKRQEEERQRIEAESTKAALDAAEEAEKGGSPDVADQILELAADSETEPARPAPLRGGLTGATTSVTKTWKGRVGDIHHLCRGIANGNLDPDLVTVSQAGLDALAREWGKAAKPFPDGRPVEEIAQYGIVAYQKAGLATR